MMTDPIGDMLTRIRNGQRAKKAQVNSPASKLRARLLDVLQREGYIRGYTKFEMDSGKPELSIELKYHEGEPVISRKSTRLNSSHVVISYAVFCLKKKKQEHK